MNGLVLNLDKCSFVLQEIEYLGHKITVDGIVPLRRHVDALLLQPHPHTFHDLIRSNRLQKELELFKN